MLHLSWLGLVLGWWVLAFLGIGSHDSCSLKGSCSFLGSLPGAHLGPRWTPPETPLYHAGEEGGQGWHLCYYILPAGNDTSMVCKSVPRGHGLSGQREATLCPICFTCPPSLIYIYPLTLLCFGMWDLDDILPLP